MKKSNKHSPIGLILFIILISSILGGITLEEINVLDEQINTLNNKSFTDLLSEEGYEMSCLEHRKEKVARFELVCQHNFFNEISNETIISKDLNCNFYADLISYRTIETEINKECIKWVLVEYVEISRNNNGYINSWVF